MLSSRNAISPQISPGPICAILVAETVMLTLPAANTYSVLACFPWETSFSSFLKLSRLALSVISAQSFGGRYRKGLFADCKRGNTCWADPVVLCIVRFSTRAYTGLLWYRY